MNISYFPLIVYIREKKVRIQTRSFRKKFFDSQTSQPLRFNTSRRLTANFSGYLLIEQVFIEISNSRSELVSMQKKVLVTGMTSNIGGVECFIMNYFRGMNISGDRSKFYFLTFGTEIAFADEVKERGGIVIALDVNRLRNLFEFNRKVKNVLYEHAFDIVWLNDCSATNAAFLRDVYSANKNSKRIIHAHNSGFMRKGPHGVLNVLSHYRGKIIAAKYATDFWACSETAGKFFYSERIRRLPGYKIINNAISVCGFKFDDDARAELRRELGAGDKIVIGHVGRFHFQKNHAFLIDIFNAIHKTELNSVLALVGDGELMPLIQDKVSELGLADAVKFLHVRNDVNRLLSAFDVFLLPSLFEGLGIVGIEAQCAGLPLLCSDVLPDELLITDLVARIPLKKTAEYWADIAINAARQKIERADYAKKVSESGYDITTEAEKIRGYFS
jgi:glycosyltransferase involved in cell wall biosynthesis